MIIYLDTETTGLCPGNICQLSYVLQTEKEVKAKNFYFAVDNVEYGAYSVHGLSPEILYKLSNGRVKLAAGTLYGAINTLLEKCWITSVPGENGDRKKEYQITELGKKAVFSEIERLKELVENGEKLTGGWTK